MKAWPIAAAAGAVVLVAILANQRRSVAALFDFAPVADGGPVEPIPDDTTGSDGEVAQGGGAVESALASLDPLTYWPTMTDQTTEQRNLAAFLLMIRTAEGTAGPDGYRTMFGYRYFDDYSDHPRNPMQFTSGDGRRLWSSAAGAYQFMARSPLPGGGSTTVDTWDRMQKKLELPDFGPASQDAAATQLIDDAGALNDVKAGRFDSAVSKVRGIWASLPGAGYGQPERKLADLRKAFVNAGGTVAA